MFLHLLNDTQQRAFLALANQFIAADSTLAEAESNALELMMAEMNFNFDEEPPRGSISELAAAFDSRQARAAALLELIALGHADASFHPDEDAFVRELASHFGVAPGELQRMDDWVRRQEALAAEVQQFWQGE